MYVDPLILQLYLVRPDRGTCHDAVSVAGRPKAGSDDAELHTGEKPLILQDASRQASHSGVETLTGVVHQEHRRVLEALQPSLEPLRLCSSLDPPDATLIYGERDRVP
jgi:hypothetical protein